MKNVLLIVLFIPGMLQTSRGQQYFNIRDPLHSNISLLTSVVQKNNKYYCTGFCIDSINYVAANNSFTNISGVKFAVYDSAGYKILDTVYQKAYMRSVQAWNTTSLYAQEDGKFLLATQYQDTAKWYALILSFDSLGRLLSERQYAQPYCNDHDWYKVTDFKPTGTGEWLLFGDVYCTDHERNTLSLVKLDSNFNIIWSREYGDTILNSVPGKVIVEPDGYILTSTQNNANQVWVNFTSQAQLIKTDTAGNIQWDYLTDINELTFLPNDVIKTPDGGYIYCGSGDGEEIQNESHSFGQLYFKGWVEKINSSHQPVWHRSYNDYYNSELKFIKQTASGDLNLFGEKFCPFFIDTNLNGNSHYRGWFLTISPNGDSITEHTYYYVRTCSDVHHVNDVKQTTDGGYIIAGESTDMCANAVQPTQRGWLVKIDSNGCIGPITCDQPDTSTAVQELTNLSGVVVYPNPAQNMLYISYSNIPHGQVLVFDVTGRLLIEKELDHSLDIGWLAPGLYIYRVTEHGMLKAQGKFLKE